MAFKDELKILTPNQSDRENSIIFENAESAVKHFKDQCKSSAMMGEREYAEYAKSGEAICFSPKKIDMYLCGLYFDKEYRIYGGSELVRIFDLSKITIFEEYLYENLKIYEMEDVTVSRDTAYIITRTKKPAYIKSFFTGREEHKHKNELVATVTVFKLSYKW